MNITTNEDTMFEDAMNERSGKNNWHCDDIFDGKSATKYPQCVLDFLAVARSPAHGYSRKDGSGQKQPELYADIVTKRKKERVKIVMASRFGDVGITTSLKAEYGYTNRVFLEELSNFSDKPDLPLTHAVQLKRLLKRNDQRLYKKRIIGEPNMNDIKKIYELVKITPLGERTVIQEVYSKASRPSIDMFALRELQESVSGYFEVVQSGKMNIIVLANEDGLMRSMPYNGIGSQIAGISLVGDVGIIEEKP